MARDSNESKRIRSKIQASIERAEEDHKRELFKRRIELARAGVRAYQARRMGEAVKAFHTYLTILEEFKGVPTGGLHPGVFDLKVDLSELLLISGVYWDLAKMYDRTKSVERQREFKHYMEKYILFTRGMPFQSLASETLRKYISNEKPVHREEFKNAYKMIATSKCFVATSMVDVISEGTEDRLRAWRDGGLSRTVAGRAFIRAYYRHGGKLAAVADRLPLRVRALLGRGLDRFVQFLPAVEDRADAHRPKHELPL